MRITAHYNAFQDEAHNWIYADYADLVVGQRVRVNGETGTVAVLNPKSDEVCVRHDDNLLGLYLYDEGEDFEILGPNAVFSFEDLPTGAVFCHAGRSMTGTVYSKTGMAAARSIGCGSMVNMNYNTAVELIVVTYTVEAAE